MPDITFINGKQQELISVRDRGFLYGDGLFETILCIKGRLILEEWHLARLHADLKKLNIFLPSAEFQLELKQIKSYCSGLTGIVKIMITRGLGARGYKMSQTEQASRIFQFIEGYQKNVDNQKGIKIKLASYTLANQVFLAGVKHLNRLEQVQASFELKDGYCQELLLQDDKQYVIEGLSRNLFIVKDNEIFTPLLDRCGVKGVMRDYLLNKLSVKLNLSVSEKRLSLSEVLSADELFLCNSVCGIWPITAIDVKSYSVGNITQQLQKEIAALGY